MRSFHLCESGNGGCFRQHVLSCIAVRVLRQPALDLLLLFHMTVTLKIVMGTMDRRNVPVAALPIKEAGKIF